METCYKMVDLELMRSLDLQSDRFDIEVEITAKLLKSRQEIMQVPVSYYPEAGAEAHTLDRWSAQLVGAYQIPVLQLIPQTRVAGG